MIEKTTVLLVDDHPIFREGAKSILSKSEKYEIIAEAGSAEEAIFRYQEVTPQTVLMDICLPDKSGIQLSRDIRKISSDCKILVVSMYSKIHQITEALRAGVLGYVIKESIGNKLLQGLDAVSKGEYFFDETISRKLVQRIVTMPLQNEKVGDSLYGRLTPREKQVLRYLTKGCTTKEVAARLFISPKTAENHRASIMKKLGLQNTLDLLRYAVKLGMIDTQMWK